MRSTLTRTENRPKLLTSPKSWFLEANFLTSLLHLVPSVKKSADTISNNFWWDFITYTQMASAIVIWSSKISCLTMSIIARSLTLDLQPKLKEEMAQGSAKLELAHNVSSHQKSLITYHIKATSLICLHLVWSFSWCMLETDLSGRQISKTHNIDGLMLTSLTVSGISTLTDTSPASSQRSSRTWLQACFSLFPTKDSRLLI